jgi:hypothetical protein
MSCGCPITTVMDRILYTFIAESRRMDGTLMLMVKRKCEEDARMLEVYRNAHLRIIKLV